MEVAVVGRGVEQGQRLGRGGDDGSSLSCLRIWPRLFLWVIGGVLFCCGEFGVQLCLCLTEPLSGGAKARFGTGQGLLVSGDEVGEALDLLRVVADFVRAEGDGGSLDRGGPAAAARLVELGAGEVEELFTHNPLDLLGWWAGQEGEGREILVSFGPVADGGAGDAGQVGCGGERYQLIFTALEFGPEPGDGLHEMSLMVHEQGGWR